MDSHPSGNDIIMVRAPGGVVEARQETALLVHDVAPWIDIGFRERVMPPLIRTLTQQAGGDLIPLQDWPTAHLKWYRWKFWDEKEAQARRRGEFVMGGGGTGISTVRVYVEPGRIFSATEHQRMVEDIGRALQDATWETRAAMPGVRVRTSVGVESIPRLAKAVEEELSAAASIVQRPAVELAPTRPGEKGMVGSPRLHYTTELPENHLVGWWAAHRVRALRGAQTAIGAQVDRLSAEQVNLDASLAPERARHVATAIAEGRGWLAIIERLRRKVAPFVRQEAPNLRAVGPAVTRDPRRRRLLDALRSTMETSTIEVTSRLSRYRERPVSHLFETWGAVAIVDALLSLEWRVDGAPRVRWLDERSPDRIAWTFSRGEDRIDLIYEPHAERRALGPQSTNGPYLHQLQRAAVPRDRSPEPGLFAIVASASPDYAIVLRSGRGLAFTVGDALSSDFDYAKSQQGLAGWKSVREKLTKVAKDYARGLGWWSQDYVTACSALSAFVLVPGDGRRWLAEQPVAEIVNERGVLLLGGLPREPALGESIPRQHVERIVETLRAHAIDGSHRMPHLPGRVVGSEPGHG